MKNLIKALFIMALLAATGLSQTYAQRGQVKMMNAYCNYDLTTVEEITGEIVSIKKITEKKMKSYGVHLIVKTTTEEIEVHLGPGWFIEDQKEQLATGDIVIIDGSRITCEEKPAFIAREIKRSRYSLLLRDANGLPLWRGKSNKL
jgi:hypothetical protein